jgi:hypothetical protein
MLKEQPRPSLRLISIWFVIRPGIASLSRKRHHSTPVLPVRGISIGATEYVANRTLVRTGIISTDLYLKMLETNVGMYEFWSWAAPFQGASQSISLRDAGSKTALPLPKDTVAKTYNRAGVYNGGWVATYCIDMMIQQDTNGKKGPRRFISPTAPEIRSDWKAIHNGRPSTEHVGGSRN